jgi:hypothetical protein
MYAVPVVSLTNFAKLAASPATLVDTGDYGGLSRHDYEEITTDGTETTGDRRLLAGSRGAPLVSFGGGVSRHHYGMTTQRF